MRDAEIEKALENMLEIDLTDNANYDSCRRLIIPKYYDTIQRTVGYIKRLKEACQSAIQSFTRMETLYKVKCTELECAKEQIRKDTAKEIMRAIAECQTCSDGRGKRYNRYELDQKDFENIADRFGVEVDDE